MSPRFSPALLLPAATLLSGLGGLLLDRQWGSGIGAADLGPVLALSWSAVLALAAFAWAQRHQARWEHSLALLELQASGVADGRFELVGEGCVPEMMPLARTLNSMSMRLRGVFADEGGPAERLRRQAQPDPATGLDNRAMFLQRLTERLGHPGAPDGALLVVRLSLPEDIAGVTADEQARRIVEAMCDMLCTYPMRVPGSFVGRLSGRDFALCLPAHGLAAETATTLLAAWRAGPASQIGNVHCVVGAVDRLGGQPVSLALATVEQALAEADARGPYSMQVCSARESADSDAPWAGRLGILRAIDEGRVCLAEFPVLDRRNELLHLECPMRLRRDPQGDWESADQWLTMAARHRLMAQVDMKAVQLALRAIAGDGIARCAHVSAQSLSTAGFTSAIREMLEIDAFAARSLWIEIAEVSFENLSPRLRGACTAWRRNGVRLGIEHAGTGLKNLVGIQDLGLDYVKVASLHACGAAGDDAQRSRALAMVALVHSLGAMVIAEGVERPADVPVLWSLGFDGLTGPAISAIGVATRPTHEPGQLISPA